MLRVRLTFNLDYMYCICESSCCLFLKPVTCYVGEFTVVTIRIRKVIQSPFRNPNNETLGSRTDPPWCLSAHPCRTTHFAVRTRSPLVLLRHGSIEQRPRPRLRHGLSGCLLGRPARPPAGRTSAPTTHHPQPARAGFRWAAHIPMPP